MKIKNLQILLTRNKTENNLWWKVICKFLGFSSLLNEKYLYGGGLDWVHGLGLATIKYEVQKKFPTLTVRDQWTKTTMVQAAAGPQNHPPTKKYHPRPPLGLKCPIMLKIALGGGDLKVRISTDFSQNFDFSPKISILWSKLEEN